MLQVTYEYNKENTFWARLRKTESTPVESLEYLNATSQEAKSCRCPHDSKF